MRPLEEEVLLLGSGSLEALDSKASEGDEENPEGDDDADVASEMRVAIVEAGLEIGVTGDESLTRDRSLHGASEITTVGRVSASRGDERDADTGEVGVVELGVKHGEQMGPL